MAPRPDFKNLFSLNRKTNIIIALTAIVITVILAAFLVAPIVISQFEQSKLTEEKAMKVKVGMKEADVHKLIGKPTETGTAQMKNFSGKAVFYKKENLEVWIAYSDDKVRMVFVNGDLIAE